MTLVPDAPNALLFATDGVALYWTNTNTNPVNAEKLALDDPAAIPVPIASDPQMGSATGIALDATSVYWTAPGGIWKAPK